MWNRNRHRLTRQELHDLVWSEPAYKVAARYGISGPGLAKICRKFDISVPERGYWNRVQAGHKVSKGRFKPAKAGSSEDVVIVQGHGPRPPKPPEPELDPHIVRLIEAEALEESAIVVPDVVVRLHPEAKKMGDAAQMTRGWDRRLEPVEAIELRRRRILHALFRAIEERKGKVTSAGDVGFDVELLGSTFKMSCAEVVLRKRIALTKAELKARSQWEHRDYKTVDERTGLLRIRTNRGAGSPKDFVDAEGASLETRLNDVMIWLLKHSITVAERDRRAEEARVAAAERARREHEAEVARWRAEEERRKEKERVNALIGDAERWRRAENLRAYVRASCETLEVKEEWKTWALAAADELDPLVQRTRNEAQ
jgi:hypothetical protein